MDADITMEMSSLALFPNRLHTLGTKNIVISQIRDIQRVRNQKSMPSYSLYLQLSVGSEPSTESTELYLHLLSSPMLHVISSKRKYLNYCEDLSLERALLAYRSVLIDQNCKPFWIIVGVLQLSWLLSVDVLFRLKIYIGLILFAGKSYVGNVRGAAHLYTFLSCPVQVR